VVLPAANAKDLRDIPAEVRNALTFTCVATMDEVLAAMLLPPRPNGFAEGLPLFDEVTHGTADSPAAAGPADAPEPPETRPIP
jgi:hypothetical protein